MLHVVKVAAALLRQHSLSKNVGVESNDFYKVILIDKDKDQVDGSLQRIGSCLFENPSEECAEVLGIHRLESWEVRQRYFTCHTTISKKNVSSTDCQIFYRPEQYRLGWKARADVFIQGVVICYTRDETRRFGKQG
jgi:hypothetical protein